MTSAAQQLNLRQSAVSWKIKRLEERVGRELLIRDGRSLRPSRDGQELLGYARAIIDLHDEAVARLSSSELTGRLHLGATEEVSAELVGNAVSRFDRVHPGVIIDIIVDRGLRLEELLDRGELDLALVQVSATDLRQDDTVLWQDDQVWICAPDWTFDEGTVPLVTFGKDGFYRPLAEQILSDAGIGYRAAFSGPSSASLLAAVEAGFGVALMSSRSVSGRVVTWPRGESLPDLPVVQQVARASPGPRTEIVNALIADIANELGDFAEP
jgi:DNA-binding transcriptional LysR family regulator